METEPVSLDDMKLNTAAEIEGWGTLNLTACEIQDGLGFYNAGATVIFSWGSWLYSYAWSGSEAQYIILYADILNTQMKAKDYLTNITVKAVYDDLYEYGGWAYQRNYNNDTGTGSNEYKLDADRGKQNTRWAINSADQFPINPMYEGHYIYGCTLPNAVINGKGSLKLVITIDGNEITYNIRK